MAFRSAPKTNLSTDSPESLFADIKSKQIPGLLTQQGDVLREYVSKFVNSRDLAAQLPTGSGKTLVALLIGEWRRLTRQERVVYLCPTNQLVHQVTDQAQSRYGLDVVPFTGSRANYTVFDKTRYTREHSAICTTSRSGNLTTLGSGLRQCFQRLESFAKL
jgi:replicative superfamily II helicase